MKSCYICSEQFKPYREDSLACSKDECRKAHKANLNQKRTQKNKLAIVSKRKDVPEYEPMIPYKEGMTMEEKWDIACLNHPMLGRIRAIRESGSDAVTPASAYSFIQSGMK